MFSHVCHRLDGRLCDPIRQAKVFDITMLSTVSPYTDGRLCDPMWTSRGKPRSNRGIPQSNRVVP